MIIGLMRVRWCSDETLAFYLHAWLGFLLISEEWLLGIRHPLLWVS